MVFSKNNHIFDFISLVKKLNPFIQIYAFNFFKGVAFKYFFKSMFNGNEMIEHEAKMIFNINIKNTGKLTKKLIKFEFTSIF